METVDSYTGTELHRLALHFQYEELGVSFMECDGWLLPRKFQEISEEVALIWDGRGYVDFSDHGVLKMEGNEAIDLLHRISTNDFRRFKEGSAVQTVLLSEKGRLVDSVVILHRNDHLLVITSRGAHRHVSQWIEKFIIMEDVKLSDETGRYLLFFHCTPNQGRQAPASMGTGPYTFKMNYFDLSCTFHIGDDAFSMDAMMESEGLVQVGNEAFEIFRIRKGIPVYGKELIADYNPLELGLRGQMSFAKGCYVGQEVIARLDTYKKVQKKLCRVRSNKILPSNKEYRLFADGKEAGSLTSHIPNIGKESGSIGLAMVKGGFANAGARLLLREHDSVLTVEDFAENLR